MPWLLAGAMLLALCLPASALAAPTVTLDSPPSGSVLTTTSQPAFSGTASTATSDPTALPAVTVRVYAGTAVAGTPVEALPATSDSASGAYGVTANSPLPDGTYTAQAEQDDLTGAGVTAPAAQGSSTPIHFEIKVHSPALTLTSPAAGFNVPVGQPTFSGRAGANPGDAASVSVNLHTGSSATGRSLGHRTTPVRGGRWTLRWPRRLALGVYTLVVAQRDNAGHTTSVITTFGVVRMPPLIGSRVTLSGSRAAVPIACPAASGTTCRGTVLVVSTRRLQTRAGGPVGPVRLLFAYVALRGGRTQSVRGSLPAYVIHALRGVRHLQVRVTVSFASLARSSAIRTVS